MSKRYGIVLDDLSIDDILSLGRAIDWALDNAKDPNCPSYWAHRELKKAVDETWCRYCDEYYPTIKQQLVDRLTVQKALGVEKAK
jgi:hypothetical protein